MTELMVKWKMEHASTKRTALKKELLNNPAIAFVQKRKEMLLYLLFLFVILTQGLFYSFTIPFGQVPDEMTHYEMIEEEFGTSGYVSELDSEIYQGARLVDLKFNSGVKVDQKALAAVSQAHFSAPLSFSSFHPQITIVRHLPCGIGFYLGIALHLPMIWCAHLAEIFAVLFYALMGLITLRTVPMKKDIFAFCMLIPEALQQCSSVNYDSVLIPCAFLLIAYILKLYYSDTPVRWKNILIILLITGVVTITKPPFGLIALCILIIPAKKYDLRIGKRFELVRMMRKHWYIPMILIAGGMAAGIYLFRNNYFVKTIVSDLLELPQFVALLFRTGQESGYYYITGMIGIFGWLDSAVSPTFILAFLVMMTYLNSSRTEHVEQVLNTGRRIWMTLVFAGIMLFSAIALQGYSYDVLGWDTSVSLAAFRTYVRDLPTIMGFQGRYFIPCLPVLLIAFSSNSNRKDRRLYWIAQITYYTFAFIIVMHILNGRYYG